MKELYPFMKNKEYIEIVKIYRDALYRIEEQYKYQTEKSVVRNEAKKKRDEINDRLNTFYNAENAYYEQREKDITNAYKNKQPEYSNPQAEILKRQDFDLKVSIADDNQLADMAKDTEYKLSEYQLNRLTKEFKERELDLTPMRVRNHDELVGLEHRADPNYKKLAKERSYLMAIMPRGNDTTLSLPLEDKPMLNLRDLDNLPDSQKLKENIAYLNKSIEIMQHNVMTTRETELELSKPIRKDIEKRIDNEIAQGTLKEYTDTDLRAIEGTPDYTVTDEFKYLKERYHKPNNYLYSYDNPSYDIMEHIEFLREQHQQNLQSNPQLAEQIQNKLDEAKQEETESVEEDK